MLDLEEHDLLVHDSLGWSWVLCSGISRLKLKYLLSCHLDALGEILGGGRIQCLQVAIRTKGRTLSSKRLPTFQAPWPPSIFKPAIPY